MKFLKICTFIVTFVFAQLSFAQSATTKTATAIFAGGCFWCMQADLDEVKGVIETTVGYTGGDVKNPTYEQVSGGDTGHYEAVRVIYNPEVITYPQLLDYFWHHIDPTDASGQFCDEGKQYRSAIFYTNGDQKNTVIDSDLAVMKSGQFKQVFTRTLPAQTFYPAEEYHQKYYKKNPIRYYFYRYICGRDAQLKKIWGK